MKNELISVVIPTWNRANTIVRAVRSVLLQDYKDIEIIIIDDASTDNTFEVVSTILDSRIKYFRLEKNVGPAQARNMGIKYSSGKYIAFQDSDDYWEKSKLSIQMKSFQGGSSELGLVYTAFDLYIDGLYSGYYPKETKKSGNTIILEKPIDLYEHNKIGTPTMLVKRECIDKIGGFNEELLALEDWEFAIRICQQYSIAFIDKILVKAYTNKKESVNHNILNVVNAELYIMRLYLEDIRKRKYEFVWIREIFLWIMKIRFNRESYLDDFEKFLDNNNICDKTEYEVIKNLCKQNSIYKYNYEIANLLSTLNKSKLGEFVHNSDINFVIYGMGLNGQAFYKILSGICRTDIILIDQDDKIFDKIKVLKCDDYVAESNDIAIIMPEFYFDEIRQSLENRGCKEIFSAIEFLNMFK